MTNQTIEQAVEEFGDQFDELNMKPPKNSMPGLERELLKDFMRKALTADRLALLTELRDCELLEEKEDVSIIKNSPQWVKNLGHNTLARAIKAHLDELINPVSV